MTALRTLLEMAGAAPRPAALSGAALVLIDIQNEYFAGPLRLAGVEVAAARAAGLLTRARAAGAGIVHVRHRGRAGGAFDPEAERGAIHAAVAPLPGEAVIEKTLPNAFAGTGLLAALGGRAPVIAGFMTHMCVSATARAALDLGLMATVASDATAARDLPDPLGGIMPAETLHRAALAALADRFAAVVPADQIPD